MESTEPQTKKLKLDATDDKIKHNKTNRNERDRKTKKRKLSPTVDGVSIKKSKITGEGETVTNKLAKEDTEERKRINKSKEVKQKAKKDVPESPGDKVIPKKTTEKEKLKQEKAGNKKVEKMEKAVTAEVGRVMQKMKEKKPTLLVNKVRSFQKPIKTESDKESGEQKRVKFVLKNNCMQGPVEYYQSVRRSPSIPFDSRKRPSKTNLKPSTPSPINPFFKKKMRIKN